MWPKVINPAFHLSRADLGAEHARLHAAPRTLARPVIILGGWRSPAFTARTLARALERLTSCRAADFHLISYPLHGRFDSIVTLVRQRLATIAAGTPTNTVDIVAISMGGLVARAALLPTHPRHTAAFQAARLFTIATPYQGASLARWFRPDDCARAMAPGSATLRALDDALPARAYELICYAQLRDWWIGTSNAAPPAHDLHWTDVRGPLTTPISHFVVNRNPLITLDIARRLRNQQPLTQSASPLPHRSR